MACVYILYSEEIDRFYVGSCANMETRLKQHLEQSFDNAYTARAKDWKIFFKPKGF